MLSIKDQKYDLVPKNLVTSFKAQVDAKDLIPHLLTFTSPERSDPVSLSLTVAGQQPMCLKCRDLGHHHSNCQSGLFEDDSRKSTAPPVQSHTQPLADNNPQPVQSKQQHVNANSTSLVVESTDDQRMMAQSF